MAETYKFNWQCNMKHFKSCYHENLTNCYQMMYLPEELHNSQGNCGNLQKKRARSICITPFANHLSGLGPIQIPKGQTFLMQLKKYSSEINLKQISEDVSTKISKRLLASTISLECLNKYNIDTDDVPIRQSWRFNHSIGHNFYWTPNATTASSNSYKALRRHLKQLQDFQKSSGTTKKKTSIWSRMKKPQVLKKETSTHDSDEVRLNRSYHTLRKQLKMDISVSSWDFDSTILSYQLTLIDRDLFLMITPSDIQSALKELNSGNSPNLQRIINFSDRIASLIATEVIRLDSMKMRARLIGKYINVADKLHRLHNMHSTHSVLAGLTMPAIYRLKNTWNYIRRHHYSKYKRLKTLLRLYKDVRRPLYSKMFEKFSRTSPYLPSIKCLLYGLIGHMPQGSCLKGTRSYHSMTSSARSKRHMSVWRTQSAGGSLSSETTRNSVSSDSGEWSHSGNYGRAHLREDCGHSLRLETTKMLLIIWQQAATGYDLIDSPLVREFLLKAKYLEDIDAFMFSQSIEPPIQQ